MVERKRSPLRMGQVQYLGIRRDLESRRVGLLRPLLQSPHEETLKRPMGLAYTFLYCH